MSTPEAAPSHDNGAYEGPDSDIASGNITDADFPSDADTSDSNTANEA